MTTPATEMGIELPDALQGHWETSDGREMAQRYASQERSGLCHGDVPDMALANAIYMADRNDLDLIGWQTAAKERIRWLSAQLALATRPEATRTPEAAQVEMLREALTTCAKTFRRYGELHRAKGTTEGNLKASNNDDLAEFCEGVLADAAALAQVRHPEKEG